MPRNKAYYYDQLVMIPISLKNQLELGRWNTPSTNWWKTSLTCQCSRADIKTSTPGQQLSIGWNQSQFGGGEIAFERIL
jgi:hypothetical protein